MKQILMLIGWMAAVSAPAQEKSNRGKEFWLGYGNCISFNLADNPYPVNNQNLVLYISTEEAATVTVSVNGTTWSRTVSIPANSVDVSITLPKSGPDDCRILNEGLFDRAVHIVSSAPVVVYAHEYNTQLSGATLLLPVETYGYTYYSINFKQPNSGYNDKNWFYVIASEDNTRLEITPSDTTETGVLPGQTFTVNLNKGQLYNVFGKTSFDNICDLTGSKIVSVPGSDGNCHPVAVFSGTSRLVLCNGDGGEAAQQQIFPASAWGTRYLTFHSIVALANPLTTPFINFYRVIVNDPTTIVKRNGVILTGLQRNSYYEFSSNSGDYIESDKPVIVGQYTPGSNQCTGNSPTALGDPELLFLPSIEQGIKKTRVYNTKNANITVNYLTIILPNNGVSSLRVNGAAIPASQRIAHPNNSNYTVVARRLIGPASQITIESDSAFTAMLYGAGIFESYGYIAGTLINNLNSKGSIRNVYNSTGRPDSFTCPRSPFNITMQTAYRATRLEWLLSQVPGIAPARDTVMLSPEPIDSQQTAGRWYYTYTLTGSYTFSDTGSFSVPVRYSSPEIDHCSQTETGYISVRVKTGPVADLQIAYPGCSTDTATLTGVPDWNGYPIRQYQWAFSDGRRDTALTVARLFPLGDHPVTLQMVAENGCLDDTTFSIRTFPKPVALFGAEASICTGDSVLLSDSSRISAGSIAEWRWDFADGNQSIVNNNQPFYHRYNTVRDYPVSLVVISDRGCASDSFYNLLRVNNRPGVSLSYSGKWCVDSSIVFTPVITSNGNLITGGLWDLGDGTLLPVTHTNPVTHAYASPVNSGTIRLVVQAASGCTSDTASVGLPVIHPEPSAAFTVNAGAFCVLQPVQFTYTGGNSIASWQWNFGNGSSADPAPLARRYSNGGEYPVSLQVTSTDGCGSKPFTQQVTIYTPPAVDAGPSIVKIAGAPAQIMASLPDTGVFVYEWTPAQYLNDGTVLNPVTSAPVDILYTLKVKGGPGNCEASDTVTVRVLKNIFIPNAFTPDGNGRNDQWNITGINNNPSALVSVYNRWGQLVYESRGYARPWDGTLGGKPQPAGAYYYVIRPDVNKPATYTGYVMLLR